MSPVNCTFAVRTEEDKVSKQVYGGRGSRQLGLWLVDHALDVMVLELVKVGIEEVSGEVSSEED